jgi:hypothetical protein
MSSLPNVPPSRPRSRRMERSTLLRPLPSTSLSSSEPTWPCGVRPTFVSPLLPFLFPSRRKLTCSISPPFLSHSTSHLSSVFTSDPPSSIRSLSFSSTTPPSRFRTDSSPSSKRCSSPQESSLRFSLGSSAPEWSSRLGRSRARCTTGRPLSSLR